ncbi:hypothetical protein HUJ05_005270 [Dendroctonus ponderosae]|nr:hypothetical protein HUJ05_005270 [Dendroctonus ponderosae]
MELAHKQDGPPTCANRSRQLGNGKRWIDSLTQVLVAQDKEDLEFMTRTLFKEYEECGLSMNRPKTKYLYIGNLHPEENETKEHAPNTYILEQKLRLEAAQRKK